MLHFIYFKVNILYGKKLSSACKKKQCSISASTENMRQFQKSYGASLWFLNFFTVRLFGANRVYRPASLKDVFDKQNRPLITADYTVLWNKIMRLMQRAESGDAQKLPVWP